MLGEKETIPHCHFVGSCEGHVSFQEEVARPGPYKARIAHKLRIFMAGFL